MSEDKPDLSGPDLAAGVEAASLADGAMLLGHALGRQILLVRRGGELFAVGATCTHYGGPLSEGLLVDDTVRCPWHHACYSLRSGEALRPPALRPIARWRVEEQAGTIFVREKLAPAGQHSRPLVPGLPASVVIVGGGAAGNAAAETLRREGYPGRIAMLSADDSLPCDRPNLSKGYLAGTASADSNLLRSAKFYADREIEVSLGARVAAIDVAAGEVVMAAGARHAYGALLLATGAEPVRLDISGADLPHVHYLRTVADSRALVAGALQARRAVLIGASFIGLEVAASLRARGVEVHVVGREAVPMARILGPDMGTFLRQVHEDHGVVFHLGATPAAIDAQGVTLDTGETIAADLVVIGIGVRPSLALAEQAGLAIDRGVTVDAYLETSLPRIFAAGDIARWPDPLTGERIRVEHFVVAERQGRTAALNILGHQQRFAAVPFFWTEQYDLAVSYVGHGDGWDEAKIDGSLEARDCAITYRRGGRKLAVATIFRDLDSLRAELDFERADAG
jgi:NADPH-dependent 2,4-dienoyl-CoA reductase/sulfur reductase-like enzyme/nitrite reductase/ring-hydroxylating ferredoxin subunit